MRRQMVWNGMVASIPGIKSGVRERSNDKTNVAVLWRCQHGSLAVSRWLRCNSLSGNAKRPRYYSSRVSVEWRNSVYIWPTSCCMPSYVHGAVLRDTILSITISVSACLYQCWRVAAAAWDFRVRGYQRYIAKWKLRRTVVSQHVGQMNSFEKSLAIWTLFSVI
jgi:hypothetical protein